MQTYTYIFRTDHFTHEKAQLHADRKFHEAQWLGKEEGYKKTIRHLEMRVRAWYKTDILIKQLLTDLNYIHYHERNIRAF